MPWSSAALTADEVALKNADKPLAAALNAAYKATASKWSDSGAATGTDRTDADFPAANAYDRYLHEITKPSNAVSGTTWFFHITLPGTEDIDNILLGGHNFGTIGAGGGLTVTAEIADSDDWLTNPATIATWNPGTSDARLVELILKHTGSAALRYSGVTRLRIKVTRGATNFVPELGEVFLGRRRQLRHKSDRPWSGDHEFSRVADFVSGTEIRTRYLNVDRVAEFDYRTTLKEDDVTAIAKNLWSDSKGGVEPILWIENPNSAPGKALWMMQENPVLELPETENGREWELQLREQGGLLYSGGR